MDGEGSTAVWFHHTFTALATKAKKLLAKKPRLGLLLVTLVTAKRVERRVDGCESGLQSIINEPHVWIYTR